VRDFVPILHANSWRVDRAHPSTVVSEYRPQLRAASSHPRSPAAARPPAPTRPPTDAASGGPPTSSTAAHASASSSGPILTRQRRPSFHSAAADGSVKRVACAVGEGSIRCPTSPRMPRPDWPGVDDGPVGGV
jgi:hypothetical protein